MSQESVYAAAGFGGAAARGVRPAVVVVDFSYGFTDVRYPTAAEMGREIAAARRLTDLARAKGFPVIYTTIAFHPGEIRRLPWLRKAAGMAALLQGTRLVQIDAATGVRDEDIIVVKKGASAFHGSALAALLTGSGVDTVIVCGATTSGCVRATVVDSVQYGFNTLVARDACADRAQAPHDSNLYDMQQKYADVTSAEELEAWLGTLPTATTSATG